MSNDPYDVPPVCVQECIAEVCPYCREDENGEYMGCVIMDGDPLVWEHDDEV